MTTNESDSMTAAEMKMWERRQRENNFVKLILIEVLEEGFCTKVL